MKETGEEEEHNDKSTERVKLSPPPMEVGFPPATSKLTQCKKFLVFTATNSHSSPQNSKHYTEMKIHRAQRKREGKSGRNIDKNESVRGGHCDSYLDFCTKRSHHKFVPTPICLGEYLYRLDDEREGQGFLHLLMPCSAGRNISPFGKERSAIRQEFG